jgi:hypothetical protein
VFHRGYLRSRRAPIGLDHLGAHRLSDVVTGVLLGSVCAIVGFAIVDEVRHRGDRPPAADQVDTG